MIGKGRIEAVDIGFIFEFHMPGLRYKGLLLFVPNFNTTSDENGTLLREVSLMFFFISSAVSWPMAPWSIILRRRV